ncbi:MAG: (2Fe-2S)-binding protein [Planctomycetota bacterium]
MGSVAVDDQEICLCFGVSRRKVCQFIRVERPTRVSQLSQCFGAGTGCGWCRETLAALLRSKQPESEHLPSAETYAAQRRAYNESR